MNLGAKYSGVISLLTDLINRGLQISVRFWPKSERRKSQKRTDRSLFISKANGTEWPSIRPVVLGNGYKWALAPMMMFGMP